MSEGGLVRVRCGGRGPEPGSSPAAVLTNSPLAARPLILLLLPELGPVPGSILE